MYLCFESFTSGRRPPNTQLAAIKGNKILKNNSVFKSLDTAQENIAGTFLRYRIESYTTKPRNIMRLRTHAIQLRTLGGI